MREKVERTDAALSPMQRDVLYLLARGRTTLQIAEMLQQTVGEIDETIVFLQGYCGVVDRRRLIVHAILTLRHSPG